MVGTITVEPAPVVNESDIILDEEQQDSEEIQSDSSIHLDAIYLVFLLIFVYFVGRSRGTKNPRFSNLDDTTQEE